MYDHECKCLFTIIPISIHIIIIYFPLLISSFPHTRSQSIIEEEGISGKASSHSGSTGSAGEGHGNHNGSGEHSNWDQPLIIAEPDVKV